MYLVLCAACTLLIIMHEFRHPQKMMIMNLVWPITAMYFGPLAVWGYFRSGSRMTRQHHQQMQHEIQQERRRESAGGAKTAGSQPGGEESGPSREQVYVADTHCGAGCTLGDIAAETSVFALALTFVGGEFGTRLALDFILAWSFGVVFQYFTIVPMMGLSFGKGLLHAMRADTLSIISFQIGLFAWMALTYYVFFPDPHLKPTQGVFWFMMQLGMILGFFTSYPVNIFLLKSGWKEKMPQYKHEMKKKLLQEQLPERRAA